MRNLGQSDFNLFTDYIYVKIVIVLAMNINFLMHQYDVVTQFAGCNLKQLFYCRNISLSHFSLLNSKGLAYLINKIM